MAWLRVIDRRLEMAERILIVVLFVALIGVAVAALVARNLLNLPHQRLLEAIPMLVLWLTLAGSLMAIKEQRHIRLELLRQMSGRWRQAIFRAVQLFAAGVTALLLAASLQFVHSEIALFGPSGWLLAAMPLFFALASLRFVLQAVQGAPDDRRAP